MPTDHRVGPHDNQHFFPAWPIPEERNPKGTIHRRDHKLEQKVARSDPTLADRERIRAACDAIGRAYRSLHEAAYRAVPVNGHQSGSMAALQ